MQACEPLIRPYIIFVNRSDREASELSNLWLAFALPQAANPPRPRP